MEIAEDSTNRAAALGMCPMCFSFEVFTAVCRGHANYGRSWEIHQLWNIFEASSYWDPGPAGSLFRGSSCSPGEAQSNSSK